MEIKASDLRIGNWVTCYKHTFRVGVLETTYAEDMDADEGGFTYEDIQGIPLTPEILLKAGFEKQTETVYTIAKNNYMVYLGKDRLETPFVDFFYFGHPMKRDIKYLHELQNLVFALTSTELKIEL